MYRGCFRPVRIAIPPGPSRTGAASTRLQRTGRRAANEPHESRAEAQGLALGPRRALCADGNGGRHPLRHRRGLNRRVQSISRAGGID
jgi:hypothetical protein